MFDLTTIEGVLIFLSATPFAASSVIPLSGGHANSTYRVILREPFTAVNLGARLRTVVLKHAESYVALDKDFPFGVERQVWQFS